MVIKTIIENIKRDAEKRSKQIIANRENGKNGGRPTDKKPKRTKKNPVVTQDNPIEPTGLSIPNFIDAETWNSFLMMRRKAKAPPTEKAITLIIKDLTNFEGKKAGNANLSLENSITNNWKGVFEPKPSSNFNNNNPRIGF